MYRFFCESDAFVARYWPAGPDHNHCADIANGCHWNLQRRFHRELDGKGDLEFQRTSLRYDQLERAGDAGEERQWHLHGDDQCGFRYSKQCDDYGHGKPGHPNFDYPDGLDHHPSEQQHRYLHRQGNVPQ